MNKKLAKLIKGKKLTWGDILDCYNQKIIKDIAPTITTRVSASNNLYLVVEKWKKKKV